ncbi:PAQR family membrane homeostasis protein TrhA [Oceanisphaera sp. IT1-181]|uniref:PAQR family membrane homeostasis protein TrhA n=1 Tax=Oceanisphaera sp. IT1-181 TaxID=3081199 RepID=UPI0029C9F63A|nr:hemolysin III family protein [Oceanisphaera sp. IT1-181]
MFHQKGYFREQTKAEETANTISHGLGLVAALVGTPLLIMQAARIGDTFFVVGASLFALTIIFMYLSSSIYHFLPQGKAKHAFRVIEHCAIFLLIAGTYTPILLGVLYGVWGWTLLAVVWGIALVGVFLKMFAQHLPLALSTSLYLLMGWIIIVAIVPLLTVMPIEGIYWLVAGGVCYSLGVLFFVLDGRLPFGHFIWHLWVLAGTTCHYFTVYWYGA